MSKFDQAPPCGLQSYLISLPVPSLTMSEESFHQIDPNGDVVLILRNPDAPFAVWEADLSSEENFAKECPTAVDIRRSSRNNGELRGAEPVPEPPPATFPTVYDDSGFWGGSQGMTKKRKKKKKSSLWGISSAFDDVVPVEVAVPYEEPHPKVYYEPEPEAEAHPAPEPEPEAEAYPAPEPEIEAYPAPEPEPEGYPDIEPEQEFEAHVAPELEVPERPEVKYLVSSRHLALSSRYFSAKLSGPWIEAAVKHIDGCYHMDATEWDSEALLILMRVIHGKTRSVPRHMDLEMLAKLAVLVDYYECHEVIEIYCPGWIGPLSDKLPADYGRDMVLWLLISHVFQQYDIFQQMTRVAVLKSADPVRTMELPIPSSLVDLVDWRRQDAIEFILRMLQKLLDAFRNGTAGCSFECSSILLGALTKEMDKHNLLDPKPAAPYSGYSIENTEKIIRAFRSPQWCSEIYSYGARHHPCTLGSMIDCHLNADFDKCKQGFKICDTVLAQVNGTQKRGKGRAISFSAEEEPVPILESN
ncbi:hypothetical protein BDP55DRAFT_673662 [Colletotrichum godetiae]|uniref:BTB domain-containing protein n=1 Tax=Colletotrichum godetiae TaxID=1209918 RepID=A0AAJ0AHC5_9PEZI|nr:uncharacterized protein BDP55DRAFT_673662 [Colletotrichum godetiae]KAK1672362.1 hypothetical protein BDP55DRAFT_673662 [Colletotrichum godetiae]